jgi:hypothetical protein
MIIVRVELLSAITGKTTELARMEICNEGDSPDPKRGNYSVRTLRGRSTDALNERTTQRTGKVANYPRLAVHVWNLVARALKSMGYNQ